MAHNMYGILPYLAIAFYLLSGCTSGVPTEYDRSFENRRDSLINYYAEIDHFSNYTTITAKLARGKDIEKTLAQLDSLFDAPRGNMFWMYPSLSMYLHTKPVLPEDVRKRYRDLWRTYTSDRGDTENHWVMYYATLYLAAQEWPDEPGDRWYTGKSSSENKREAEEWLIEWMRTTTTIGQGEFDSPHYMAIFLAPVFLLYEFAEDPVMKRRAEMMIDYMMADFAVEYLRGNYCGAHSRDMIPTTINPLSSDMTAFGWLFFGDTGFSASGWALGPALSSYRLPEVIYHIATDRSEPYVHLERKRLRNIIRFGDELNPPVYKYTYMTKDFALGSLAGGIAQPIQQHTWDVTFVSDKPNNTLFTIHPYYSEYEVGKFFPEPLKILLDGISRVRPKYQDPNKWVGSSPYTQTMQHKNAIVVLFNIDEGIQHQHINGFFPKTLDRRVEDESGWIVSSGGNVYIGYYPLKPYEWIEEEINWRLRSYARRNGLIVEVVSQDDYESFGEFRAAMTSREVVVEDVGDLFRVRYTTTGGDELDFSYDGARVLNGEVVEFATEYLFRSRFMEAEVGSESLRMTAGGITRDLDFNKVTIRERR
jgi:hypothetical protein